ncbi:MAG: hypothetical protein K2M94_07400 [Paramuribaculum sp.]|nr:hypothetical protein [Paramuribaculum sp.]
MKNNKAMMKGLMSMSLLLSASVFVIDVNAQSVIFPQVVQPGTAVASTSDDGEFTLNNDLITATFVNKDNHLKFGGCPEMGLKPGTEIFKITLGDETTTVGASEMTLKSCRVVPLTGNSAAAVGSEKLDGQAIVAELSYGDLDFEWKAVLRDGSHYLRTELVMTANKDVAMHNVVPMIYEVNVEDAPEVVGNTRGAVLASSTIFAGLETPTGINSIITAADADDSLLVADDGFSYNSWSADTSGDTQPADPAYWKWVPGSQTPQGVTSLGFSASNIRGKRGYVNFASAGNHTATFKYVSGTHGLNVVGVDVVSTDGVIVASDYHVGFTGGMSTNNVYTLNIPQAGVYLVRYFVEIATETITANGTITWSPSVTAASAPATADKGFTFDSWSRDTDDDYASTPVADPLYWTWQPGTATPQAIISLGFTNANIRGKRGFIKIPDRGNHTVKFQYLNGSHKLNIVGVDLVNQGGQVVASDYHKGSTGGSSSNNTYTLNVPEAGIYFVRYFIEIKTESVTSTGSITWSPGVTAADGFKNESTGTGDDEEDTVIMQGLWSRHTTLQKGKSWKVSAVVGLIAPDQSRRSFLAYSERERAVPWRAFPLYNSWYELNIDRNNSATYANHMTTQECVDVINQWHTNLFENHQANIQAFVWDDGWDSYGTWTFNKNFPNGFDEPNAAALRSGAGIGAWLGPVGGYGNSGELRRQYWTNNGGMQLSNPAYYNVFLDACKYMIDHYDFRFFKLDGISAQFSSVGPDAGYTGEENAEGIINILSEVRKLRPDMFFNTTVGTWASPFWFHYSDAVWRQEADHSTIGNQGDDRERWITYRDRLVYQNFVQNSPLCPINTLMTHGFILTTKGDVSKSMNYDGIVRELRCAFACGSGMVELYCDADLLNSINGGALWGDIAECIQWQEKNADVLPDAHWVGGNPWDGSKANVYGWAAWNGEKATLTLRNPATYQQTFTFTLRDVLEVPDYFNSAVSFQKAFENQANLGGFITESNVELDDVITVTLPGSSVFVFDGVHDNLTKIEEVTVQQTPESTEVYDLLGRQVDSDNLTPGLYVSKDKKFLVR